MKHVCTVCGYVYDEVEEDEAFDMLSANWFCPVCGAPLSAFIESDNSNTKKKGT